MRRLFLFLLTVLSFTVFALPASAEKGRVVQCGIPSDPPNSKQFKIDPGYDYCNIYARQLAYPAKRREFRAMLEKRREHYEEPGRRARQAYEAAVKSR